MIASTDLFRVCLGGTEEHIWVSQSVLLFYKKAQPANGSISSLFNSTNW